MAARIELSLLPPFDPVNDPSSLSQRWKQWTKRFQTYLVALNVTEDKQKRALLLYQAGQATQEIFDTIPDTGDSYDTAMTKLTEYFSPKKNVDYEIFQFRQAAQQKGETVAQFTTRLRKLAANCEFADLDKELKSAIIQNCESKRLRRFALREDGLTLEALLAKARALEASESQAAGIEQSLSHSQGDRESVNQVYKGKRKARGESCHLLPSRRSAETVVNHGHTRMDPVQRRARLVASVGNKTTMPRYVSVSHLRTKAKGGMVANHGNTHMVRSRICVRLSPPHNYNLMMIVALMMSTCMQWEMSLLVQRHRRSKSRLMVFP